MEVVASALTVVGAGIQGAKTTKDLHDDYRNADGEVLQAQHQSHQLHLNRTQLDELSKLWKENIGPAQASLREIEDALPRHTSLQRKRDRLKWMIHGKKEFERHAAQQARAESSLTLNMLLSLCPKM